MPNQINTPELHDALLRMQRRRMREQLRAHAYQTLASHLVACWVLAPYDFDLSIVETHAHPDLCVTLRDAFARVQECGGQGWQAEDVFSGWTQALARGMKEPETWHTVVEGELWEWTSAPLRVLDHMEGGLLIGRRLEIPDGPETHKEVSR